MITPKISDLEEGHQILAQMEQVEQGNLPNRDLLLIMSKDDGNFSWAFSFKGWDFWHKVEKEYRHSK